MSGEYKVGYANPPKENQFKKGQSGNPRGRQRKVRAHKATEVMRREFMVAIEQEVTVNQKGRKRKMSAIRALYDRILAKALNGDFRAMKLLSETYYSYVTEDENRRLSLMETLLDFQKARDEESQARVAHMTLEECEQQSAAKMVVMAMKESK